MKASNFLIIICLLVKVTVFSQSKLDSLKALAQNSEYSDSIRFYAYHDIASHYIGNNNDSAAHYNQLSASIATHTASEDYKIDVLSLNTEIYVNRWSLDSLKQALDIILEHRKKKADTKNIVTTLINLGGIHANRGYHQDGIEYYLQALDYAKADQDFEQQGKINFNIGAAYYNATLFTKSRQKFREAAALFKQTKSDGLRAICLNSISNAFNNEEKIDSALWYAEQTLAISDSIEYIKLQSSVRSTIGAIHINKKEYSEAAENFEESLDYAEILKNDLMIANCLCNLGRAKYHLQEYADALAHIERAYSFNIFKDNNLYKQFCIREYAWTLQKTGRVDEAFEKLNTFLTFQDSVLLKENKQAIAELESKYQSLQKDTEIERQQQQLKQQSSQQKILFGGLSSLALISFLIINRLFLKQRLTKNELDIKEEKIQNLEQKQKLLALDYMVQGQEEERRRIAKDLHDGLGGILSTARLQLHHIEKEIQKLEGMKLFHTAEKLLENASQEVRRIAHDMMPDALMNLGLQAAVEDLANNVNQSQSLHVKTQFYLADTILPEKMEVMLFRIIQEILNNAIKHAQATQLLLQLSLSRDQLHLTIEDNGKGFDQALQTNSSGIGIKNIKSRVNYLNGELHLDSTEGMGTSYDILIPL